MLFIRTAGCTVGKGTYPFTCTLADGQTFECDTDYRKSESKSIEELVTLARVTGLQHVSLTGGEPLMHKAIDEIISDLSHKHRVHIETSGTIPFQLIKAIARMWITVSPKKDCLQSSLEDADEIKLLIGENTNVDLIEERYGPYLHKLWLQPINHYDSLDSWNMKRVFDTLLTQTDLAKQGVRFSIQMHKAMGVR